MYMLTCTRLLHHMPTSLHNKLNYCLTSPCSKSQVCCCVWLHESEIKKVGAAWCWRTTFLFPSIARIPPSLFQVSSPLVNWMFFCHCLSRMNLKQGKAGKKEHSYCCLPEMTGEKHLYFSNKGKRKKNLLQVIPFENLCCSYMSKEESLLWTKMFKRQIFDTKALSMSTLVSVWPHSSLTFYII